MNLSFNIEDCVILLCIYLWKFTQVVIVWDVSKLNFYTDYVCDACLSSKQTKITFKSTPSTSTSWPLEIIHMDLFRLISTTSLGGKSYNLIIIDDFTRFT